jgi:uncharacterized protein (TIGR03437 family)
MVILFVCVAVLLAVIFKLVQTSKNKQAAQWAAVQGRVVSVPMNLSPRLIAASFCVSALAAVANNIQIASTGQNVNSTGHDTSYTILSNTIIEPPATSPLTGPALVVTLPPVAPQYWLTVPGSKWIAPDVDQSNGRNGCCAGVTKYQTTFSMTDANGVALDPSTVKLTLTLLADDTVDIYLNGTATANKVYSGGVYQAATTIVLTKGFQAGTNTLEFDVTNSGLGATGLNIYAIGTADPMCVQANGTACPPTLDVSPNFVTQGAVTGTVYSAGQPFFIAVRNTGGGGPQPISVTPSTSPQCPSNGGNFPFTWSNVSTTVQNAPALFLKVFGSDPGGNPVAPGIYQSDIRITSGTQTQDICLISEVTAKAPVFFSLGKTGLLFNAQAGQGTHTQTVPIFTSAASVDWTAKVKTLPGDNFLTVSPTNGTTTGSLGKVTSSIVVSVAPQTAAGIHYGVIEIHPNAPGMMPAAMVVVYNVTAAPTTPDLSTAGLVVIASPDSATAAQSFSVLPSSAGSQPFTLATTSNLFTLPALSGTASGSTAVPVQVSLTAANLRQGFNTGTIQVQANGVTQNIDVRVILLPTTAVAKAGVTTTNCTPQQITAIGVSLPGNFSRLAGWPAVYQTRVIDDCGNPVTNATVVLTFSNGEQPLIAQLEDASTGTYTATWNPSTAGNVTVTARASSGTAVSNAMSAVTTTTGTVAANSVPMITRRGTVHNLNPLAGAPLAPGTIAALYGSGLSASPGAPSQVPLPTSFQGTTVTIAGIDAPLFYAGSGQINLQIPAELPSYGTYPVVVTVNGAVGVPDSITIADVSPGVAAYADGTLIAQHLDYSLVSTAKPAVPGETLIMYLAGLGTTNPAVPTNGIAPSAEPLARPVVPVTVTVAGAPAATPYAGLTPGAIGLAQIDFTIPLDAKPGNLTVLVKQNGVTANSVTVAVAAK